MGSKSQSEESDASFESWWREYPRRVGKGAAKVAYEKAILKGLSDQELLEAIRRQAWSLELQYIPHPATWLNQERWADDPLAAAPSGRSSRIGAVERMREELMGGSANIVDLQMYGSVARK